MPVQGTPRTSCESGYFFFQRSCRNSHAVEGTLEVNQGHQHRRLLARVAGQKVERGWNAAGLTDRVRGDHVTLVVAFDDGAQCRSCIDEDVVAATVRIAVRATARSGRCRRSRDPSGIALVAPPRRAKVVNRSVIVDDVADELTLARSCPATRPALERARRLRGSRPCHHDRWSRQSRCPGAGCATSARCPPCTTTNVFSAMPSSLSFVHHLAHERIDVALQAVLQEAPRDRDILRAIWEEARHHRPVGDVERLAGLGVALDEIERPLLGFGIDRLIGLVGVVPPLPRLVRPSCLRRSAPSPW